MWVYCASSTWNIFEKNPEWEGNCVRRDYLSAHLCVCPSISENSKPSKSSTPVLPKQSARWQVSKELYQTESNYVDILATVLQVSPSHTHTCIQKREQGNPQLLSVVLSGCTSAPNQWGRKWIRFVLQWAAELYSTSKHLCPLECDTHIHIWTLIKTVCLGISCHDNIRTWQIHPLSVCDHQLKYLTHK